jgi:hypothetical protein
VAGAGAAGAGADGAEAAVSAGFWQAARATANREAISSVFFMNFSFKYNQKFLR